MTYHSTRRDFSPVWPHSRSRPPRSSPYRTRRIRSTYPVRLDPVSADDLKSGDCNGGPNQQWNLS
jgi:hypothetical protein